MPEGLRRRDAGPVRFYFNYAEAPVSHGGRTIPAAGVLALKDGRALWSEAQSRVDGLNGGE
jgi:hypothetical protein